MMQQGIWKLELPIRVFHDSESDPELITKAYYEKIDQGGDAYTVITMTFRDPLNIPPAIRQSPFSGKVSKLFYAGEWYTIEMPYEQLNAMIDKIYLNVQIMGNN